VVVAHQLAGAAEGVAGNSHVQVQLISNPVQTQEHKLYEIYIAFIIIVVFFLQAD
jgi:TRAP-type C4-dicarboxylate transport system permease small subunit